MTTPLLEVRQLSAGYGPIQALHQVSLHVAAGEIVTLIGANGAGKSTLLMSLFGTPAPTSGSVWLAGREITGLPAHEVARLGIAIAPEGRRVFPDMTVAENLAMGAAVHGGIPDKGVLERIYHLFPRLLERQQQRAGALSGGEQQMLAIGRALVSRPRLLLLDEPSLGLAPMVCRQIFATLRQIAREGTTIFLVEQNANQALRLAHRGYVLVNGTIRLAGESAALLSDPEIRRAYLGE
ncbi:MAG: ABC transporter ATP-binding protein [Magnetococcales bacterium]|nr:ABC transporter ATP-binding protein [Magnetococcales bacterium]NGZ27281.1 ABC transporter ATP-binding protein [Magnetococcales bacterium]